MNEVERILSNEIDRLLILSALHAELQGVKRSISDYYRDLTNRLGLNIKYAAVRRHLKRLEKFGMLKGKLVRATVRNDLTDEKGNVRVKRHTKVYVKVYGLKNKSKLLKRIIMALEEFCDRNFEKKLKDVLLDVDMTDALVRLLKCEFDR